MGDRQGHPFRGNQYTTGLPAQARLDDKFSGSTEAQAQAFWKKQLEEQSLSGGLVLSHESPGDQVKAFRDGSEDGVFGTLGAPSEFVTTSEKTRVWFRVPYTAVEDVVPDQRYGGTTNDPYLDALTESRNQSGSDATGTLRGVDVFFAGPLPKELIARIERVKDGKTTAVFQDKQSRVWDDAGPAGWSPPRAVTMPKPGSKRG